MLTTLRDGTAFAERFGSAPATVVALHGWARTRADFAPLLGSHPHALALDLPGFGATPAPEHGWSTADYATWLAGVLADPAVAARPVVVGHSFGGRVAVQLAAVSPELFGGLVLTGAPLYRAAAATRAKPSPAFRLARWLNRRGLLSDTAMERRRRRHGSADYRAASGVMRDVLVKAVNEDYAEQVAAIARAGVPVALVWGRGDDQAPLWIAERAGEVLGTAPVVTESGHLLDGPLTTALAHALAELES